MADIINGRALAKAERLALAAKLKDSSLTPHLAIILVGDHEPSRIYVRSKQKAGAAVGIQTTLFEEPATITEADLLARITQLNNDPAINGILLQLPLPAHLDKNVFLNAINPLKDVDGLTPTSQGLLMAGLPRFVPCTPLGCLKLIHTVEQNLTGLEAVIVGRSAIVGNPLAQLLQQQNCTVTVLHQHTKDLAVHTKRADILVAAAGKENLITADMIKPGAIVIDVGINRRADGTLTGDIDFAAVNGIARAITPVPGGVGPMTIACLMANTVYAAELQAKL